MKRILLTAILFATLLHQANAQNASNGGAQTTNLGLSNAIELTFVGGSTTTSMPFTSLNDLVNGVESTTQQLRVRSNKTFDITATVNSANFTYSGSSIINNILPVSSVLKVTCTQASTGSSYAQSGGGGLLGGLTGLVNMLGSWLSLNTTTPTKIVSNCAPGGNQTFTVKYKTTPGINAAPGSYTTSVIFTATQQ